MLTEDTADTGIEWFVLLGVVIVLAIENMQTRSKKLVNAIEKTGKRDRKYAKIYD